MTALQSYSDFAAVARRLHADELASVLEQARPGMPFAPYEDYDRLAALTRFRRVLEEQAGVIVSRDEDAGTCGYEPSNKLNQRQRISGFVEMPHAILAGVRSVVAPLSLNQKLETYVATSTELRWLFKLSNVNWYFQQQRKRFSHVAECRDYMHIPDASMLVQRFREPTEFAPEALSLAGFTFFGNAVIVMIESLYHGGGTQMLGWLQQRHDRLVAFNVYKEHAQAFFERQSFAQVVLPFPREAADRIYDRPILAWSAQPQDAGWVQDKLVASDMPWWISHRRERFANQPYGRRTHSNAFFERIQAS